MELRLAGHKGIVRSIAFTQDDTRLLSASTGNNFFTQIFIKNNSQIVL